MGLDQVITITLDGSVRGLQRKDGFDLRQLGEADIRRASEVLWNTEHQAWYVEFRNVPEYPLLTIYLLWDVEHPDEARPFVSIQDQVAMFKEYDEAVQAEIATLDFLRLKGVVV